jgi:DNA-binding MarR family transcriptional regulator
MSSTKPVPSLYEKPGHLIRRLHQISTALFLQETKGYDVTAPQYAALLAIRLYPGIDQTALVNIVALDRSTTADVLARLASKRLIKRTKGALDRRIKVLHITATGEELLNEIEPLVEKVQKRILSRLSKAEQRQFMAIMPKLVDLNNELSRAPRRSKEARPKRSNPSISKSNV